MNTARIDEPKLRDHAPDEAQMRREVLDGLSQSPRRLPSKYLYDARGAELFEQICDVAEYYLTRTETAILKTHGGEMADRIGPRAQIIEPGSGSGEKARLLLECLDEPAGYVPIDISRQQLETVAAALNRAFPALEVQPICADFTAELHIPTPGTPPNRRVVFFPGSTIGNVTPDSSVELLAKMSKVAGPGGAVLVGVDLKKDRRILERAYDDEAGVSAAFALNYLDRLNRELGADFKRDQFAYSAYYNGEVGRIEMSIVSKCDQTVRIGQQHLEFHAGERVLTEYSYKFSTEEFAALAGRAGLSVQRVWTDAGKLFSVQLLTM